MKEDRLNEFIAIYKKHFDESLNKVDALQKALKIIRIVELLYYPVLQDK